MTLFNSIIRKSNPYFLHGCVQKMMVVIVVIWLSVAYVFLVHNNSVIVSVDDAITRTILRLQENVSDVREKVMKVRMKTRGENIKFGRIESSNERMNESKAAASRRRNTKLHVPQSGGKRLQNCTFPRHPHFPMCKDELQRMMKEWNTSHCYTEVHNLDGTLCSLYYYLTRIEPYCAGDKEFYDEHFQQQPLAQIRYDLQGLLELIPGDFYRWFRERSSFMWESWVDGARRFAKRQLSYERKKVIVWLQGLSVNIELIQHANEGGPLGELVQWTDTIASLYVLGYDVTVVHTSKDMRKLIRKGLPLGTCASGRYKGMVDTIYMDINGFYEMWRILKMSSMAKYRCTFRILDSFGTLTEFNWSRYPYEVPGGRSQWGDMDLVLGQLLTYYPHTDDNRFIGFVLPNITNVQTDGRGEKNNLSKPKALLYTKDAKYIRIRKNVHRYLEVISEYFEIHATVSANANVLPTYIANHGAVPGKKIQEMLKRSKLFIGVGFPYEGPGPLEAMANGAVYIQPRFPQPTNKLSSVFFSGKPTLRELSSQNPYMEHHVGEPYCFTVDPKDEKTLRTTLIKIKEMKRLPGRIPKEFTNEGMIERVYAFTSKIDYCNPLTPRWPPIENLKIHFGSDGISCQDVCMSEGLLCEQSYFEDINKVEVVEKYSREYCDVVKQSVFLHAPSRETLKKVCYIEDNLQAYSCMYKQEGIRRICPCRDYEHEQTAICKNCL